MINDTSASVPDSDLDAEAIRARRNASILSAWMESDPPKPPKFFKAFPIEELVEAGIPRADLERIGLLEKQATSIAPVNNCTTDSRMAAELNKHFTEQHVRVRKQDIQRWRTGKYLPKGVPLPPEPDPNSHRFDVPRYCEWYRTYLLPRVGAKADPGDVDLAELLQEENRDRLEKIRHARFERERDRGMYVGIEDARGAAIDVALRMKAFVKQAFERQLKANVIAELRPMGFSEEQLSLIAEKLVVIGRAVVKSVEEECERS